MLLVVCPNADAISTIASNLRPRTSRPVVAVDNAAVALRILELNPVKAIILDFRHCGRAWLAAFGRRISSTRCLVLGFSTQDLGNAQSFLPETSAFLPAPIDWDEVIALAESPQIDSAGDLSGIVAVGLEDVLSLLSMTGASAKLQVSAGLKRGCLHLRDGVVVHAERGGRVGEDVAYEIVSWLDPQVKSKGLEPGSQAETSHILVSKLLHEAARRHDDLLRLPARAEAQAIFDCLAEFPGFEAAALTHVDNGQTIATRGGEGALLHPEVLRASSEAAAFWAPLTGSATRVRGAMFWHEDRVIIAVPVKWQLVLTVANREPGSVAALRHAVMDAARALVDMAEQHVYGEVAGAANDLRW